MSLPWGQMGVPRSIAFDSVIWIYLVEENPKYATFVKDIIRETKNLSLHITSSVLVLTEFLPLPLKEGRIKAVGEFQDYI